MHRLLCPLLSLFLSCSPISSPEAPHPTSSPTPIQTAPAALRIFVLDIGQGDATLVIGPTGKNILIDGGPPGAGSSVVLPTLAALGITQLNWIIATHYDADHISGIPEVLAGKDRIAGTQDDWIPTVALLDRGDFTDKKTPTYRSYVAAAGPYRKEAQPATQLDLGDGATAEVIVVNGRYSDGRSVHLNPDEENEACIGLLIQYGAFKYFTAGDLTGGGAPGGYETKDMESIAGEIVGDLNVLHTGHHGSASSTNEHFLEETKPEAAVISVGKDNDYGHPSKTVLRRLSAAGITVYRTDQIGTIEIETDGKSFEITPAKE